MSKTYAVIMAGGSGTRFWPASRASRPKQLLSLAGGTESLLAATVRRLDRFCAASDVIVVTGAAIAGAVEKALPALDRKQILCEPVGRNTAPCVAWATWHVLERDPDANLMVLPSDHHIENEKRFLETVSVALGSVQGGALATIGIVPTRPETGYGYIETGSETDPKSGVFRAARFVEKPDYERAVGYVKSGKFLWNAGMFFFNAKAMAAQVRKHLPELAKGLDRIFAASDREAAIQSLFPELPSISIDHGVMEKADEILVVPGDFGWNDVGSWQSAWELAAKDERGNALEGSAIVVDGDRNLVRTSNGKLIAMVGVSDLVVVETEDAVLVLPRERAQDVREIIERLKKDTALSKLL
ncbi:MAG: mannose-1-phosphate guanylyltransferase [Polyangiaceae bacterium]